MQTGRAAPMARLDPAVPGERRGRAAAPCPGGGGHPPAAPRTPAPRSALWAALAAATLAVMTAGCGAGLGLLGGTGRNALAYSGCMRSHGIPDFPDPMRGGFTANGNLSSMTVNGVTVKESNAQYQTADQACQQYLGEGTGGGPPDPQLQKAALAYSQCMRSHGITSFPDPKVTGHSIRVAVPAGTVANSPQFQAANSACQSLLPGGPASH